MIWRIYYLDKLRLLYNYWRILVQLKSGIFHSSVLILTVINTFNFLTIELIWFTEYEMTGKFCSVFRWYNVILIHFLLFSVKKTKRERLSPCICLSSDNFFVVTSYNWSHSVEVYDRYQNIQDTTKCFWLIARYNNVFYCSVGNRPLSSVVDHEPDEKQNNCPPPFLTWWSCIAPFCGRWWWLNQSVHSFIRSFFSFSCVFHSLVSSSIEQWPSAAGCYLQWEI